MPVLWWLHDAFAGYPHIAHQIPKHIAPKVITPEQNQTADAWKFGYRQVGVNDLYKNKLAGVYLHHKA